VVARATGAGLLIVALSAIAVAGLWSVSNSPADVNWSAQEVAVVGRATAAIERGAPPGPVNVRVVTSEFILPHYVAEGIAYRLLNYHVTGISNGPTEAQNLIAEKLRRVGHGMRNFENYRLRLLLHSGVAWNTPSTARIRGRHPRLVA